MGKKAMELPLNTIIIVVLVVIVLVAVGMMFFMQFGSGSNQLKQSQSGIAAGISNLGTAASNVFGGGSTSGSASTPSCKGTTTDCNIYDHDPDTCDVTSGCSSTSGVGGTFHCRGTVSCSAITKSANCKGDCSWN